MSGTDFQTALVNYLEQSANYIWRSGINSLHATDPQLPQDTAEELRSGVKDAEQTDEFDILVGSLASAPDYVGSTIARIEVENFLRRSGTYLKIYRHERADVPALVSKFMELKSSTRATKTRYLAPVYSVDFAGDADLGDFEIRNFPPDDLARILDLSNNAPFYGGYPQDAAHLRRLSEHWFIDTSEQRIRGPLELGFATEVDFDALAAVDKAFTQFPKPVERAVELLTLWDWEGSEQNRHPYTSQQHQFDKRADWYKFSVPGVITIDEDWLDHPSGVPDLPSVDTTSMFDQDGEEVGEGPSYPCYVSDIPEFTARLRALHGSLQTAKRRMEWSFIPLALGFLTKAFLADGLEDLLWHIVVLEALMGERTRIQEMISTRLAHILDHKGVADRFKELYRFRSDLVHGDIKNSGIYSGHLREARKLARLATIWFLNYVAQVDTAVDQSLRFVPTRKQLLKAIDVAAPSEEDLRRLVGVLPKGFPTVDSWIGYFSK
jgi:hypothetical protein